MEVSHRTGKKYEKQKKDIDTLMDNSIKPYPFLKDSSIEKESLNLLDSYSQDIGEKIIPPIPVFDIIEYLGYDIDFPDDGIYSDKNFLGGLLISEKIVQINENLNGQEGRMNFTAAHETGHIVLHAPTYIEQMSGQQLEFELKDESNIICRKDEGFEGTKKAPEEWQADKFAAYLLMPTKEVKRTFFKARRRPIDLSKRRLLDLIRKPRPIRQRGIWIADRIIKTGNFVNVSKLAMLNRLIGLGLVRGIGYQKLIGV